MSHLIGTNLLGYEFVQDPIYEYIKIDNVVVGESKQYGYSTEFDKDIGRLLRKCLNDINITAIVYNWKTGYGYIKTGMNLNDKNDYKINKGYTTFIIKKKVECGTVPSPVPAPIPVPVPGPGKDGFLKFNNNRFEINGNKFVPVGFNCYWLAFAENRDYPSKEQIEEIFKASVKLEVTTIRCHTLGANGGSSKSLRPWDNNLNEEAFKVIDYVYYMAKKYNIKLILPLVDCYYYYHGDYGLFCKSRGINDKNQFWYNKDVKQDFKEYIYKLLNRVNTYTGEKLKDCRELIMIENGNEFNYRPGATSTTIPPEEWLNEIHDYIRSIDENHLIFDGTDERVGESNNFNIKNTDVLTGHYYWVDKDRINRDANKCASLNKGYIIGEYDSKFGYDFYNTVEINKNVHGTFSWSIYCHEDGKETGRRVPHDDGYTFWYDNQSESNTKILLNLTNHCRRMRNLPTVNKIFI